MQQTEIYEKLTEVMRDVFDDEALVATPGMTANDVKEWDSVNHVSFIIAIEEEFGIKFKTSEVEKMKNVGQMVEQIEAKTAAK